MFKSRNAKSSAKTLSAGLFAAGTIGIARAMSRVNISELQKSMQGNSEDVVNKQDLISLYDYINKITQEENYNIYGNNLDCIKTGFQSANQKV